MDNEYFTMPHCYDKSVRMQVRIRRAIYYIKQHKYIKPIPRGCVWNKAWNRATFPGFYD